MSVVTLPRVLVNQILHHAQLDAEREVCGLIGAHAGQPVHCYVVDNLSNEPRRLFSMDPRGQIDAMREMRAQDETLFAIYHSHPDTPPVPSAVDLEQAGYPQALYLIVSLTTKGVLEMRGWRLAPQLAEVELEIR